MTFIVRVGFQSKLAGGSKITQRRNKVSVCRYTSYAIRHNIFHTKRSCEKNRVSNVRGPTKF